MTALPQVAPAFTMEVSQKRAALLVPRTVDVTDSLRLRADLFQAAKRSGVALTAMFEVSTTSSSRILMAGANGEFETVLLPTIKILGRDTASGMRVLLGWVAAGLTVYSLGEPWLDFADPTSRDLLLKTFATVVEQDDALRAAKVREGQARAKARGGKVGRPRKIVDVAHARLLIDQQLLTIAAAAQRLGCSASHLRRALAAGDAASAMRPDFPTAATTSPLTREVVAVIEAQNKK